MKPKTLILDSSGLLRDGSGRLYVEHIDSFVTREAMTVKQTLVIVGLTHTSSPPKVEGHKIPTASARQFVLAPATARGLAKALIKRADAIEGTGAQYH